MGKRHAGPNAVWSFTFDVEIALSDYDLLLEE